MKPHAFVTLLLACAACTDRPADNPAPETAEPAAEPAAPAAQPGAPTTAPPQYAATDPALPPSQTTPGPIPLAYRHVWAIDPADCTRDPALTRIAIAPGAVRFYEGRSVVTSAQESGEQVTLEVDHTAEGETAKETHTLSLAADGKLTYQRRGETFSYTRCD